MIHRSPATTKLRIFVTGVRLNPYFLNNTASSSLPFDVTSMPGNFALIHIIYCIPSDSNKIHNHSCSAKNVKHFSVSDTTVVWNKPKLLHNIIIFIIKLNLIKYCIHYPFSK